MVKNVLQQHDPAIRRVEDDTTVTQKLLVYAQAMTLNI